MASASRIRIAASAKVIRPVELAATISCITAAKEAAHLILGKAKRTIGRVGGANRTSISRPSLELTLPCTRAVKHASITGPAGCPAGDQAHVGPLHVRGLDPEVPFAWRRFRYRETGKPALLTVRASCILLPSRFSP